MLISSSFARRQQFVALYNQCVRYGVAMLKLIFRRDIAFRSVCVGLIVGTVLNMINQGDQILAGGEVDVLKCILTYMVPYCVATYSAVMVASN